jgi:S1-C subfamily serine protease
MSVDNAYEISSPLPPPPPPPIAFSTRAQHGPVSPFSIGAEVRAVNANGISGQSMLIVVSVVPGGPCDRAGVCAGDTLLEAENEDVHSLDSLAALMLTHARKSMLNVRCVLLQPCSPPCFRTT